MRFEHLIEINDLTQAHEHYLNHTQLWAGLLCRVEDPVPFLPGLEACEITARGDNWLERRLDFGAASIHDRVTLEPMASVRFDVMASASQPGGSLLISIESRGQDALFLRFCYENPLDAAADDQQYVDYVRSAYEQSNLDTVEIIRELANEGLLPKHWQ